VKAFSSTSFDMDRRREHSCPRAAEIIAQRTSGTSQVLVDAYR